MTDEDTKMWEKEYTDTLNKHFELAKKITKLSIMDWVDTPWTGFFEAIDPKKVSSKIVKFYLFMKTTLNHSSTYSHFKHDYFSGKRHWY